MIEKFYAGETTLEEEQQLRDHLHREGAASHYPELYEQMTLNDRFADEKLPDAFDELLLKKIAEDTKSPWLRISNPWVTGVAATILILVTIWFGTDLLQPKEVFGTIDDPKLAFNETRKVLDEVSKKMNQALTPAKKTVDKVENNVQKAGELKKMNEALQKTKGMDKLENASDLLKSINKVYIKIGNS